MGKEFGYHIRSYREYDDEGEALYWSNEEGWVDEMSATSFNPFYVRDYDLPFDGYWELFIHTDGETT